MNTPGPSCPKCGSGMEEGFINDVTLGDVQRVTWTKGKPQQPHTAGSEAEPSPTPIQLDIATYRCIGCGYLESFAGL